MVATDYYHDYQITADTCYLYPASKEVNWFKTRTRVTV